ncbi:MAG: head to tail connecting protein [Podoviridae sp. ctpVR23]|nr:MAG: head to tail connecting protein [Podoviridae sp. ctpVR23]
MTPDDIKRRLAILESERSNIQSLWDAIERFVSPYRGKFFNDIRQETAVEWRNREVFDSTAINAAQVLASSIHGSLTSPSIRWFELRFRKDELNANVTYRGWLEEVAKRIYAALQDSNFNLEINEVYTDLVSFASSPIIMEEDDEAELVFNSIPVKEVFFDEDHNGNVINFYRRLSWSPVMMAERFGKDALPQEIREKVESNSDSRNTKEDVIFCVYKRQYGENEKRPDTFKPMAEDLRPFQYKYIVRKCGSVLKSGGYYERPVFIPRWRKTSESKWGNSPAFTALPDILTLNQLVELILKATEKVVDPAIVTTERGLLSDVNLGAGGLTVVRTIDDLKPFESRARFDVSELQREKLQSSIRSAFYVDQLELKQSPAMTATEVQVRYELMQRLLGPTLGRIQNDLLSPIIERAFAILYRNNRLPELPENLSLADLDIEYVGPLSRAQKVDTAAAAERWLSTMAGLAQYDPEVLDVLDIDTIARDMADVLNVPAKYVLDSAKVVAKRKQRKEMQSRMQQAEVGKAEGEAAQAQMAAVQQATGAKNA